MPAYLFCSSRNESNRVNARRQSKERSPAGAREDVHEPASRHAYLVVGRDHGGDVADGEGLAGLQAQGHRRAAAGVGAGEHHVLQHIALAKKKEKVE